MARETVTFPPAKKLFEVDSDTIAAVRGQIGIGTARFSVEKRFRVAEFDQQHAELINVMRPLLRRTASAMGVRLPLEVDVDTQSVEPGGFQRINKWHGDGFLRDNAKAMIFSDKLPSLVAVGTLPIDHPVVRRFRKLDPSPEDGPDESASLDAVTRAAIQIGDLEAVPLQEGIAYQIDRRHLHKGDVNTTQDPIEKCFMRIVQSKTGL